MEWMELLYQVFELCVIPLLGILTTFLVKFIQAKISEAQAKKDNELFTKYSFMLSETITECVTATTETYVKSLKDAGSFDAEAQKQAFAMSYQAIMDILNADAKEYLNSAYGDLTAHITEQIEMAVKIQKSK